MRSTLGEFEEIVLLVVATQNGDAYGFSIADTIEKELKRKVTLSSVHTALYRLEEKGLVKSAVGGATEERGGRSKRIFSITKSGARSLEDARRSRDLLYNMIPQTLLKGL